MDSANPNTPSHEVASPRKPLEVAQQFAESQYGDPRGLRLRHHRGLFYRWHLTHWIEVDRHALRAQLYPWLGQAGCWNPKIGDLVPFDPTKAKVGNVLEALEAVVHLPGTLEPPCWLSEPPWASGATVAVQNGLLDLETRGTHPHTPAFFNLNSLRFAYDVDAPAPTDWLRFLRQLWRDDEQLVETLGEVIGYLLGGGTEQQKIFMLVGPKRAGKGTILRVIVDLLGASNVAAPTLSSLATNFGLQPLIGRLLAAISDARIGGRAQTLLAVERLLSISGEDAITIDRKYRDPWTGALQTRFMIVTNEIPSFVDASGAIASRFVILPLTNSFYGEENPALTDELLAEAPGIFNWALDGLDHLRERGHFIQPAAAESAIRHLTDMASPVSAFVRDRCRIDPSGEVEKDELWKAWRDWCETEGAHPGTRSVFLRDLRAAVPSTTTARIGSTEGRRHMIRGLRLADDHGSTVFTTPDNPTADPDASGTSWVEPTVSTPDAHDQLRIDAGGRGSADGSSRPYDEQGFIDEVIATFEATEVTER